MKMLENEQKRLQHAEAGSLERKACPMVTESRLTELQIAANLPKMASKMPKEHRK